MSPGARSRPGPRPRRGWVAAAALALAVALTLALVPGAATAQQLRTGFNDTNFRSPSNALRTATFQGAVDARAEIVRINVSWSSVVGSKPAAPANPADPAYRFADLDQAVINAEARGLTVLLTVFRAPSWAEGPNRPGGAPAGAWRPRPGHLRAFARALATRYSGSFAGLPRVRHFQAWTEPNLRVYLAPQRRRGKLIAPQLYRRMLTSFYTGVHSVHASNVAVSGGTAPYGDPKGGRRTRPLAFWRGVLCLEGARKLAPRKCPKPARFDVLAHHPITTSGGPRRAARHHDDVAVADLRRLRKLLRAAERHRKVLPRGRRALWVTEFWWQSKPPNRAVGVPLGRHARWIELAMYELWRQGARVAINHLVRDGRYNPQRPFNATATGVFFLDWEAKPALRAFRFPFVVRRRAPRRMLAWGKAPASGQLAISVRANQGWRVIARRNVAAGDVFRQPLQRRKRPRPWRLRAEVAGERSLVWSQR